MAELTLEALNAAVAGDGIAFRSVTELQPAGGPGDKVFPPTYEGGKYALEERMFDGKRVPCVLLDSVPSQANRMELALLEAWKRKLIDLPVISVDFEAAISGVGVITSLEAPHRLADAILRDSAQGEVKFAQTEPGQALAGASPANSTGLYQWCPTTLVLGVWDSTGANGGLGAKFQRTLVSEIVGIDVQTGMKTSSRIDPLGIQRNAGPIFQGKDGDWTLDASAAAVKKAQPVKWKKEGKPSEANHGNIAPTLNAGAGGVTLSRALQFVTLSLPALRRLQFPLEGKADVPRDDAARTVLASLALCGAVLARAKGLDLRSRCLLVPTAQAPWELLHGNGKAETFEVTAGVATKLLADAVRKAESMGLAWKTGQNGAPAMVLTPSKKLAELVKKSRELSLAGATEDED